MQALIIDIDGSSNEIWLSLQFEQGLESNRDWLVGADVFHHGVKIPCSELSWSYSAAFDTNFVYLETTPSQLQFFPAPLICTIPFDEVRLSILPWSSSAQAAASLPTVLHCRYAIRSQRLVGEDMRIEAHVLGDLSFVGAS